MELTSQPFEIPVCSRGGASGSTVTTYEPINLCMAKGDYIDFNDEGGYVPNVYPNGVPYRVLGEDHRFEDRLLHQGRRHQQRSHDVQQHPLGDGRVLLRLRRGADAPGRVRLGPEATTSAGGGTKGIPAPLPAMRISTQKDGVNHSRITKVAIFCRQKPQCKGTATLIYKGQRSARAATRYGGYHLARADQAHVEVVKYLRKHHSAHVVLTAVNEGATFTQTVTVGIF